MIASCHLHPSIPPHCKRNTPNSRREKVDVNDPLAALASTVQKVAGAEGFSVDSKLDGRRELASGVAVQVWVPLAVVALALFVEQGIAQRQIHDLKIAGCSTVSVLEAVDLWRVEMQALRMALPVLRRKRSNCSWVAWRQVVPFGTGQRAMSPSEAQKLSESWTGA